jgi:hypothetical protein
MYAAHNVLTYVPHYSHKTTWYSSIIRHACNLKCSRVKSSVEFCELVNSPAFRNENVTWWLNLYALIAESDLQAPSEPQPICIARPNRYWVFVKIALSILLYSLASFTTNELGIYRKNCLLVRRVRRTHRIHNFRTALRQSTKSSPFLYSSAGYKDNIEEFIYTAFFSKNYGKNPLKSAMHGLHCRLGIWRCLLCSSRSKANYA